MPVTRIESVDQLRALVGREVAVTDWIEVAQERIDQFAAATGDHQWIHIEADRARRESPYGRTIAHGFLTLSLLSRLMSQGVQILIPLKMAINYGLNRVRFPAAVPSGSQIRARFTLQNLDEIPDGLQATWGVTVESQGAEKPCCVAEWLVRYYT